MKLTKETKWLCEHSRNLERFSGKWVIFSAMQGVVSKGVSLQQVMQAVKGKKLEERSFVFHVPSKAELTAPVPVIRSNHEKNV